MHFTLIFPFLSDFFLRFSQALVVAMVTSALLPLPKFMQVFIKTNNYYFCKISSSSAQLFPGKGTLSIRILLIHFNEREK